MVPVQNWARNQNASAILPCWAAIWIRQCQAAKMMNWLATLWVDKHMKAMKALIQPWTYSWGLRRSSDKEQPLGLHCLLMENCRHSSPLSIPPTPGITCSEHNKIMPFAHWDPDTSRGSHTATTAQEHVKTSNIPGFVQNSFYRHISPPKRNGRALFIFSGRVEGIRNRKSYCSGLNWEQIYTRD